MEFPSTYAEFAYRDGLYDAGRGNNDGSANMPFTVYKCAKLKLGQSPHDLDQTPVSRHLTASEAMEAANDAKKRDRAHTFMVGAN